MVGYIVCVIFFIIIFSVVAASIDIWYEKRMNKKGYYYHKSGWIKY